jgi:hypothetical protein
MEKKKIKLKNEKLEEFEVEFEEVPEDNQTFIIKYYEDKKGYLEIKEVVTYEFEQFCEGLIETERQRLSQKYNQPQFKIFVEGADWMVNKLRPTIKNLIDEIRTLRLADSETKKRNEMSILMKQCTRKGKSNWSEIGRRLGCDSKTALSRAKHLGLIK